MVRGKTLMKRAYEKAGLHGDYTQKSIRSGIVQTLVERDIPDHGNLGTSKGHFCPFYRITTIVEAFTNHVTSLGVMEFAKTDEVHFLLL